MRFKIILSSILAIVLAFAFTGCKKEEKDNKNMLFAAAALLATQNTSTATGSSVSANVPVYTKLSTSATGDVSQTVDTSGAVASIKSNSEAPPIHASVGASDAVFTLALVKITSDNVMVTVKDSKGFSCLKVSSPGAKSVTLDCPGVPPGTYYISFKASVSISKTAVKVQAPTGTAAPVLANGTSSTLEAATVVFADTPNVTKVLNSTSSIYIGGLLNTGYTYISIQKMNSATGEGTDIKDAVVKVTWTASGVAKTETTIPYTTSPLPGYTLTNANIPGGDLKASAGDKLQVKITAADGSYTVDETVTYPDSISGVKIGNYTSASSTSTTISRASSAVVTWTNPATNAPQVVAISSGDNTQKIGVAKYTYPVSNTGTSGTYTIDAKTLASATTNTATKNSDNCVGVNSILTGNYFPLSSFYSGPYKFSDGLGTDWSGFVIGNNTNLDGKQGACEANVLTAPSDEVYKTTYPQLTLTD